jgi:Synergist-CTERM protein sorting domain-containing protein
LSSSNPAVADVDDKGLVRALTAGNAVISIETTNGQKDSVAVTVTSDAQPEPVVIDPEKAQDIVSVVVGETTVTVTYSDGTSVPYNLTQPVSITYPSDAFALTSKTTPAAVTFTADAALIPADSKLVFTATVATSASSLSGAAPLAELPHPTGTVRLEGTKSVIDLDMSALPAGTYDIAYESAPDENPSFKGDLAKGYVHTPASEPEPGPKPKPTPAPTKKSSGGGCDAGFAGLALLLAAPLFLRKKD